MSNEDIIKGLFDETIAGNGPAVLDLTRQGLDAGMTASEILFEALIPALEEVGARFERGDYFVPEMLIAGKAMSGALEVLRPQHLVRLRQFRRAFAHLGLKLVVGLAQDRGRPGGRAPCRARHLRSAVRCRR